MLLNNNKRVEVVHSWYFPICASLCVLLLLCRLCLLRGHLMMPRLIGLQTSGKWAAWTLPEPPRSHCTSMGVISACWREGVYVASVLLAAELMNEAMSEHEKNMRLLATSKTTKLFCLCFLAVLRLMVTICGCGSNSCKQQVRLKNVPLRSK